MVKILVDMLRLVDRAEGTGQQLVVRPVTGSPPEPLHQGFGADILRLDDGVVYTRYPAHLVIGLALANPDTSVAIKFIAYKRHPNGGVALARPPTENFLGFLCH